MKYLKRDISDVKTPESSGEQEPESLPDKLMPDPKWLEKWKKVRSKLRAPTDFNTYFTQPEIAGKQLTVMEIGSCSIPSGKILVRDPLCYLGSRGEQPYFLTVASGEYRTEICVIKPDKDGDCARYAAVRLRFTDKPAIFFEEALTGDENLGEAEEGSYFGFNVDAGLGCICDEVLHVKFCDFEEEWNKEHPDCNLYDDYFAVLFAESYQNHPEFQRSGGDWINWRIPETDYRLPVFQSGFGDGVYPVYWGFGQDGEICQLVVQFIDIELAYGKPSNRLEPEDFEVDGGLCEGEVDLAGWDDLFSCEGSYSLNFDVDTDLVLQEFTPMQKAGYDYLCENDCDLIFAVLGRLLKQWSAIQEQYSYEGQTPEQRQRELPDVDDIDGLIPLIEPIGAVIYDLSMEGQPYIGIEFSCTWDREHGFGAMLCGNRVVQIGGADTALLRWIAEEDHKKQSVDK